MVYAFICPLPARWSMLCSALLRSGYVRDAVVRQVAPGQTCPAQSSSRNSLFVCRSSYRLLLEGGADPNAIDEDRDTPLHYACSSGNLEIISLLLAKGADPTAADGLGRTPAERSTGTSVQRLLEAESYKCQCLFGKSLALLTGMS